jgi:hypothetical protein
MTGTSSIASCNGDVPLDDGTDAVNTAMPVHHDCIVKELMVCVWMLRVMSEGQFPD